MDGNDFDIVMKQLTAFRSFAYPLILTVALVESWDAKCGGGA